MNQEDQRLSRVHEDPHDAALPPLLLDRQRVIQSTAFRRLQHKTQVFVSTEDDHFRTRLTHTLEVAHVAKLLATRLGFDANLAEVAALSHDLGHAPFGHAGERALDELNHADGGFEHNAQSLRVVEYLEHPFPAFRGLNLTHAVRSCLAAHTTRYDRPDEHTSVASAALLPEGRVAALADEIAYCLHDLQDGLFAGLFTPTDLAPLSLWKELYAGPSETAGLAWRGHVQGTLNRMQFAIFSGILTDADSRLPTMNDDIRAAFEEVAAFLRTRVYRHHRVLRSDSKARRIIEAIFEAYVAEPNLLPPRYLARVTTQGIRRVATDYIAGMTDRYCLEEHARLFDPRGDF
ncbi:MAG: dGTP triphosphohydrolase [Phycisphaerae bacterium]